jgi:hypothetical protein
MSFQTDTAFERGIKRPDREIERIEVVEKQVEKGGKKWSGVFHKSPY